MFLCLDACFCACSTSQTLFPAPAAKFSLAREYRVPQNHSLQVAVKDLKDQQTLTHICCFSIPTHPPFSSGLGSIGCVHSLVTHLAVKQSETKTFVDEQTFVSRFLPDITLQLHSLSSLVADGALLNRKFSLDSTLERNKRCNLRPETNTEKTEGRAQV